MKMRIPTFLLLTAAIAVSLVATGALDIETGWTGGEAHALDLFGKSDAQSDQSDDPEGLKIREEYAKVYRENFLGDTQDAKKNLVVEGAGGCRTNPKDSFRVSPKRLNDEQIKALTV